MGSMLKPVDGRLKVGKGVRVGRDRRVAIASAGALSAQLRDSGTLHTVTDVFELITGEVVAILLRDGYVTHRSID